MSPKFVHATEILQYLVQIPLRKRSQVHCVSNFRRCAAIDNNNNYFVYLKVASSRENRTSVRLSCFSIEIRAEGAKTFGEKKKRHILKTLKKNADQYCKFSYVHLR